jgi:hypothetical protein
MPWTSVLLVVCACGVAFAEPNIGLEFETVKKSAVVSHVYETSNAAWAGICQGDVIAKIGPRFVRSADDVAAALDGHELGDHVDVVFRRSNKPIKVRLRVLNGEEVRRAANDVAQRRRDAEEENSEAQVEARAKARQAAIAADPELEPRLRALLDEWRLVQESESDFDKSVHCKQIADCYLKLREKGEYKKWTSMSSWYLHGRKTSGGF